MVLRIHTIYAHEYPAHNNPHYHCIIASIHLHRARFTVVMQKLPISYADINSFQLIVTFDKIFRFSNKHIPIILQMLIVKMQKKRSPKLQTYQDILFSVFH